MAGILSVDLTTFAFNYTRQNLVDNAILSIIDDRDDIITPSIYSVTITQTISTQVINYTTITQPGLYDVIITATDTAGNTATQALTIDAQTVIVDITPPVITYTANVTGLVINPFDINLTPTGFTHNDARIYCILNCVDNLDAIIPLAQISVLFFDVNMLPISIITTEGNYNVIFSATDVHNNITTDTLTFNVTNPLIDTPPEIQFNVLNINAATLTATISLATFGGTFTKANSITQFIVQVTDDVDGIIVLNAANITFINSVLVSIANITVIGTYTVVVTVTDSGLNSTIKNITLTVTA
jgi:hypothetical protein